MRGGRERARERTRARAQYLCSTFVFSRLKSTMNSHSSVLALASHGRPAFLSRGCISWLRPSILRTRSQVTRRMSVFCRVCMVNCIEIHTLAPCSRMHLLSSFPVLPGCATGMSRCSCSLCEERQLPKKRVLVYAGGLISCVRPTM